MPDMVTAYYWQRNQNPSAFSLNCFRWFKIVQNFDLKQTFPNRNRPVFLVRHFRRGLFLSLGWRDFRDTKVETPVASQRRRRRWRRSSRQRRLWRRRRRRCCCCRCRQKYRHFLLRRRRWNELDTFCEAFLGEDTCCLIPSILSFGRPVAPPSHFCRVFDQLLPFHQSIAFQRLATFLRVKL